MENNTRKFNVEIVATTDLKRKIGEFAKRVNEENVIIAGSKFGSIQYAIIGVKDFEFLQKMRQEHPKEVEAPVNDGVLNLD